ncbi:MAG: sulfotransferase domain-containing protein [Terriglobia bacterium]
MIGRPVEVYPDDVFLVSYPKSGNTWIRFLVGNLMRRGKPVTFADIDRMSPGIYRNSQKTLRSIPRPRVIKSHECFDPRYRRVIYILRDPRDVVISLYHFERKKGHLPDSVAIETFTQSFVNSPQEDYGTWKSHVLSWLANPENIACFSRLTRDTAVGSNFREPEWSGVSGALGHGRALLLLRYEDLLSNTAREMTKIAGFLGLKVTPEEIARAVELSSADKLKKLEAAQAHVWSATKETRKDIPFIRVAKAQQWMKALPASCIADIEGAWGPLMQALGYKLSTQSPGNSAEPQFALQQERAWASGDGGI